MSEAGDRRVYLDSMVDVAVYSLLNPRNENSYESDCPRRGLKVTGFKHHENEYDTITITVRINHGPLKV